MSGIHCMSCRTDSSQTTIDIYDDLRDGSSWLLCDQCASDLPRSEPSASTNYLSHRQDILLGALILVAVLAYDIHLLY